jgi:RNA polymerase sigma-70 factor (ECF subfamily)
MHNRQSSAVPAQHDASVRTAQFLPLFSANSRRVYTYILTLLPNRADADEVFQEVSALLWQRFDQYTPGTQFGAWACRFAYFKVLQFRDRSKGRPRPFSDTLLAALDGEMATMEESIDAEYDALAICLEKLADRDREMIMLRYSEGGEPRRIAERLQRSIKSVYKSLNRIRKTLAICVASRLAIGD